MAFIRKFGSMTAVGAKAITAVALSLIAPGCHLCLAQGPMSGEEITSAESSSHTLGARMYYAAHEASALGSAPAPADTSAPADDQWHIGFAPYLWFAAMHGYVGALGFNVGVKASPGDLLSYADLGLMGTVEARKEHWVIPVDIMWLALSDNKGLPENEPTSPPQAHLLLEKS